MPTFTIHEDQNEFMTTWDDTKAQYALIRANNIQFLVPFLDINLIKKTDLTKLIHEYDDQVFTLFNKLSGLLTNMDLDHPILGRYFVKADAHVAGAAYYGHLWTSQNGHSIKDYLTINWLPIHEIGHGYEIPNDGMDIVDVFNNVYCTIYQENYLTNFIKNSWLFGENKDKVVNELYTKLVNDHLTLLGLKSNIILHSNNVDKIMETTLKIMDGNKVIKTIVIQRADINLGTLNNGVYTFMIDNDRYNFKDTYLFVKQNGTIVQTIVDMAALNEVKDLFMDETYTKLATNANYDTIKRLQQKTK